MYFSVDANLVFGTSALDICRGHWIEIEESAYEPRALLELLDEIRRRSKARDPGPGPKPESPKAPGRQLVKPGPEPAIKHEEEEE
ncbi:hypothetical protein DXG01_002245 [Tephrocybe rancida]|nr:hypothetical protein DXG01_002245 [Tephrocybe rancida]